MRMVQPVLPALPLIPVKSRKSASVKKEEDRPAPSSATSQQNDVTTQNVPEEGLQSNNSPNIAEALHAAVGNGVVTPQKESAASGNAVVHLVCIKR